MRERSLILDRHESPILGYPSIKLGGAEIKKTRHSSGSVFWAEGVNGYLYYEYSKRVEATVLKIRNKIWMSDDWTYTESLKSFAERSSGKVLVAGLGLGIVIHYLVQNPKVTEIKIIDRDTDVIRLVSPLLPKDERIQIIESDFYAWCDLISMTTDYVPDTVIWDLAVASKERGVHEGKEILFALPLVSGRFHHLRWHGTKWIERKDWKPFQMFVHGLDRDPVGEEFVKTNEFRMARSIYMTGIVSPKMMQETG